MSRLQSRTGQKYRSTSITVDVEAEIGDFSTLDLVDELLDRAHDGDAEAKKWVRDFPNAPKWSPGLDDLGWEDVERMLHRRDFDGLSRWLWPQVRLNYPKPKLTQTPSPSNEETNG